MTILIISTLLIAGIPTLLLVFLQLLDPSKQLFSFTQGKLLVALSKPPV